MQPPLVAWAPDPPGAVPDAVLVPPQDEVARTGSVGSTSSGKLLLQDQEFPDDLQSISVREQRTQKSRVPTSASLRSLWDSENAVLHKAVPRKFLELDVLQVRKDTTRRFSIGKFSGKGSMLWESWSWGKYTGPLRTRAKSILSFRGFDLTVALMILLSAAFAGWETDLPDSEHRFLRQAVNTFLTVVFLLELCVRAASCEKFSEFAADRWHLFDTFLVVASCADSFVLSRLRGGEQVSMVAALRVIRLARLARMLRLLRIFKELWLLVAGIMEALWTLMWTWVLLVMLVYVCSIFSTRTIGQSEAALEDPMIATFFGSVLRSMLTLFQITTTEGWATVARLCIRFHPWSVIFFVSYLYVTTFAVMNVVVAVIVENTLDQAGEARSKFMARQNLERVQSAVQIFEVFRSADVDSDGVITRAEFFKQLGNESVAKGLKQLGIDMRQAENLFSILDYDDSDSLDAEEFVGGMMKAVGHARAKDVLAVEYDSRRRIKVLQEHVDHLSRDVDRRIDEVHRGVRHLRSTVADLLEALDGLPPE